MAKILIYSFVFLIWFPLAVTGQPYWLLPSTFHADTNRYIHISCVQGENFIASPFALQRKQLSGVDVVDNSGLNSVLSFWKDSVENQLTITQSRVSNTWLIVQTQPAVKEKSAEEFNFFLKEYGQDEIYLTREAKGELNKPAKLAESQFIKLLLNTGKTADEIFKKTCALPLEIVPEKNPYALKAGEMMRFKILLNGKPLFGARVKVWNRKDNRTTLQNIYTEKDGIIETRVSNGGSWMVSVVYLTMEAQDYKSYWSGLVFGL